MATQALIYEQVVPVNQQKHRDWSVKAGTDYSFASSVNSVPVLAVEIQNVATEYAVVFAGGEDAIMPAAVMGVRDKENLYLQEGGSWQAKYIPAFIRRYPFVFSSSDEGASFTLCIDEEFSGCNQEGRGERLFDTDGEHTQYLSNVLEFLKEYQMQYQRTRLFCDKLRELDLLEPMEAKYTTPGGEAGSLGGFMAISREKLKLLTGDQLADLAKNDALELIYIHLQSMRNFSAMLEKAAVAESLSTDSPGEDAPKH